MTDNESMNEDGGPEAVQTRTLDDNDPHGLIGKSIENRYTVQSVLGVGGMGIVYRGHQAAVGRDVAIKVLMPEMVNDENLIKRFHLEARAASRLSHPNTITVYDFGRQDDLLYIVMELLEGDSLDDLLSREGALSPERTARIIEQVCASLGEAHGEGIVHRDIKPDNIFLKCVGRDRDFVKVLDFGVAKLRDPSVNDVTLTQAGIIFGTPKYMSPEQAKAKKLDGRSDLYSLGVVLFECLMGRAPFHANDPVSLLIQHVHDPPPTFSDMNPDLQIPPGLELITRKALEKEPEQRYPSIEAFREAIGDFLAMQRAEAQAPTMAVASGPLDQLPSAPSGPNQPDPTLGNIQQSTAAPPTPMPGPPPVGPAPQIGPDHSSGSGPVFDSTQLAQDQSGPAHTWSGDASQFEVSGGQNGATQFIRVPGKSNNILLAVVLILGLLLLLGIGYLIFMMSTPPVDDTDDPVADAGAEATDDATGGGDPEVADAGDLLGSVTPPDVGPGGEVGVNPATGDTTGDTTPNIDTTVVSVEEDTATPPVARVHFRLRPSDAIITFGDRTFLQDEEGSSIYLFDLSDGDTLRYEASASGYQDRVRTVDLTTPNEDGEVVITGRLRAEETEPRVDPCIDPATGLRDPYRCP